MKKIRNIIRDIIKSANNDPEYFDIPPTNYSYDDFSRTLNYLDYTHYDKKTLFNVCLYLTDSPYRDLELKSIDILIKKYPKANYRYLYCLYYERINDYKNALLYCKNVLESEIDERSKSVSIKVAKRIIIKIISSIELYKTENMLIQ